MALAIYIGLACIGYLWIGVMVSAVLMRKIDSLSSGSIEQQCFAAGVFALVWPFIAVLVGFAYAFGALAGLVLLLANHRPVEATEGKDR